MPGPDGNIPRPVMPGPPPTKSQAPYEGSPKLNQNFNNSNSGQFIGGIPSQGPPPSSIGMPPVGMSQPGPPPGNVPSSLPPHMQHFTPSMPLPGQGSQASSRGSTPPLAGMPPPPGASAGPVGPPPLTGFVRSSPLPQS